MPEDPCIWDRLPGLDPEMSLADRRAARIEPYETLAGPPPPKGIADPEPFARDIRRRKANWERLLVDRDSAPRYEDNEHWIDRPVATLFKLWGAVAVFGGLLLYTSTFAGCVFVLGAVAASLLFWHWSKSAALARAPLQRICPTCQYDLRGTPSGIDPKLLGADPGPRRCSECGSAWPLLPPRDPAESRWNLPRRSKP